MQMVIIHVNQMYPIDVNPEMEINELRKYFRQILSMNKFRVIKIQSLSMIRIVLDASELLGFSKKEIIFWMSTILKSITNTEKCTGENFKDFWEFLPRLNATLWHCAENLPYPDFYQAWHNPPTTPYPEVEDNTPVASTPFTQQCNLALLPQILNQAIQSHPLNCQIICIDGSRFSDPSNPALQIYTTLKKAGCPPSPETLGVKIN